VTPSRGFGGAAMTVTCEPRCMHATRSECRCRCGGLAHGVAPLPPSAQLELFSDEGSEEGRKDHEVLHGSKDSAVGSPAPALRPAPGDLPPAVLEPVLAATESGVGEPFPIARGDAPGGFAPPESENGTRTLKRLFTWLRGLGSIETYPPEACTLCGFGANPTTGVPIRTVRGDHVHLSCMLGAAPHAQWN